MSENLVGSVIAGYRITGLLGRGGMGFVYEAEHAILGRKAAIKTLSNDLGGDGDFRERFVQESQMVAALDHPSIIPIYDAGEENGVVYIAMRHVGGGDLQGLIGEGQLEIERAVSILEQVAGALDAAHAHQLVHRDVKPANVLIDSSSNRVYLTDFGIAKQARKRGLTRTGFFVGTLDYAAPEQIQGKPVGPQADVYAFGCLLFECLTGTKPFDRETDVAVMHAHLLDPVPAATELRPELPAAIDDVLARALAKNEEERTASCREVIEAVRACLGGQTVVPTARASTIHARTQAIFVNFPTEPSPLIGRDQELAALVELARDQGVRLVTLTGPGGTGKTRLALAAATELAAELGSAFFVDLAPVRDAGIVGSAIATVLGVEETADLPLVEAIARRLGDGPAAPRARQLRAGAGRLDARPRAHRRRTGPDRARDQPGVAPPARRARVPRAATCPARGGRRSGLAGCRVLPRPGAGGQARLRAHGRERGRGGGDLPPPRRPPARDRARGRTREAALAAGDPRTAREAARPPHRRRHATCRRGNGRCATRSTGATTCSSRPSRRCWRGSASSRAAARWRSPTPSAATR